MSGSKTELGWLARLFVATQYALPHHFLSRIVHWLTRRRAGVVTTIAIRAFIRLLNVDMSDASKAEPAAFATFNEFFTRSLKNDARPLADPAHWLISPVDGTVSQIGTVREGRLLQAKGHHYSLPALLGDEALAAEFRGGAFATIYLAPYNYHRIHMPAEGKLRCMQLIPGRLFSVNAATAATVPGLFARNERVVCIFDSARGPFALVLVGAMFVGSIETVWAGEVTPGGNCDQTRRDYTGTGEKSVVLPRAGEMGRFNMGSTVIVVHADSTLPWHDDIGPGTTLRLGEALSARAHAIASQ